jgi:hypothetical protein
MYPDPSFTLADQLFWIVDCFCKTMTADKRTRELGPVSIALWTRVTRLQRRFCKLFVMWKAGTLPKARVRHEVTPTPTHRINSGGRASLPRFAGEGANGTDGAAAPPTGSSPVAGLPIKGEREEDALARHLRPASLLPRKFRWLQKMLPSAASVLAGGVDSVLLNFPETKVFVAECPQVGRVLRPLAIMAGLQVPEWLALPKRARKKDTPTPVDPLCGPTPRLAGLDREADQRANGTGGASGGEGANGGDRALPQRRRRTAREIAEALMAWSERTGKPIDIRKVSSVVWGYIVHTPRDGNCPPPEIGYGGRGWRPPKD